MAFFVEIQPITLYWSSKWSCYRQKYSLLGSFGLNLLHTFTYIIRP